MKNIAIIIISLFTFTIVQAQKQNTEESKGTVETLFEVDGVCGMCKNRIENAALHTKGVKFAEWNKETKMLKVVYKSKHTTEKDIQNAIAEKGHDTHEVKADSTTYEKIPKCCRYRGGEVKSH